MRLNFVHICDSAYILANQTPALIGIFSGMMAKLPIVKLSTAVVIEIMPEDLKAHKIGFTLESPSGKKVGSGESHVGPVDEPTQNLGAIITITNIKFEEAGNYSAKVFVDSKLISSTPFFVKSE